jgi:hypothetical protein
MVRSLPVLYLLLDQTLFWLLVHLSGRFGYVSSFI